MKNKSYKQSPSKIIINNDIHQLKTNCIYFFIQIFDQMSGNNLANFYFLINELQDSNQNHLVKIHEKNAELQSFKNELQKSLGRLSRLENNLSSARKQDDLSKETIKLLRDEILDQKRSIELLSHELLQYRDNSCEARQLKVENRNLKKDVHFGTTVEEANKNMIYLMGPSYASDFERLQTEMRVTVKNLRIKEEENELLHKCLDTTLKKVYNHTETIKSLSSKDSCNGEKCKVEVAVGNSSASVMTLEAVTQVSYMEELKDDSYEPDFSVKFDVFDENESQNFEGFSNSNQPLKHETHETQNFKRSSKPNSTSNEEPLKRETHEERNGERSSNLNSNSNIQPLKHETHETRNFVRFSNSYSNDEPLKHETQDKRNFESSSNSNSYCYDQPMKQETHESQNFEKSSNSISYNDQYLGEFSTPTAHGITTDSPTISSPSNSESSTFKKRSSSDMPFHCHGTEFQRELKRKIQHIRSKYS